MPIYLGKDKISSGGGGGISIEEITPEAIGALPETTTPADIGALPTSEKGAANGIASLNANGKVTANQASSNIKSVGAEVYTLSLDDAGCMLLMRNESNSSQASYTITVPNNADVAFPTGAEIEICRYYGGEVIIQGGTSVYLMDTTGELTTARSVKIGNRHGIVALKKVFSDRWIVTGDLE